MGDALLAVAPAEIDGAAVEAGAEVDQAVGRLHLDAQFGHAAQDAAQLVQQAGGGALETLHRGRSGLVHLDVGLGQRMPGVGELRLDGGELVAELARMIELFLQGRDQRVRFAQRKEARLRKAVHGGTVHDGAARSSGHAEVTNRSARAGRTRAPVLRSPVVLRHLTDRERDDYFRGVQPIWGGGLSPERFVAFQRRLADSREAGQRYHLFGLFEGDRLLSAMKTYDLRGSYAGTPLRLLGIGAVYTPPVLRRRGHARRMLELAIDDHRSRGYDAAVLFSDIAGEYYERLGFRALESAECTAGADELPRGGTAHPAGPVEPEWGVHIAQPAGEAAAMLRLSREAVDVLDAGWTHESLRDPLLAALRDFLLRSGRSRLPLWPPHQLRGIFPSHPRATALAMGAPLRLDVKLPGPGASAGLALLDHI